MAQLMEMPKLSDTMKEGVLRKWHKKEGDKVSPGELLAEIETDKATMDFESFDGGTLLKLLVKDGSTVAVGSPIAILGKAGEDTAALEAEAANKKGGAAAAKPAAAAPAPAPAPAAAAPAPAAKPAPAAPAPKPAPAPRAAAPAPAAPVSNGSNGKILASPLARRLATDLGVDLRNVQGTGPGGRIVERDVQAAAAGGAPAAAAAAPVAAPAPAAPAPSVPRADASLSHPLLPERRAEPRPTTFQAGGEDQTIPLTLMRKTIARRLVESKSQIPHFYVTMDIDMEAAMAFRQQVSEVHGAKLSVNDLVIKATALALRRVPECNAMWTDEGIVRFGRVDIGMAVSIEEGLLTPVIRSADVKTLGQIAQESRDLAQRARDRKLKPEDMTGSTFSISNMGMLGVKEFNAIINPPEAGILAVGAVRKEPVVKGDQIVVGQRMSITLSADHRVIDGATGAKLLQAIQAILERPITLAF